MMASKFFTALLGLFLLLGGTAHAERQQLRGSYVSIDVPVEFAQSEQFSGLVWKKAQGSILVAEMPTEAFQRIAEQVLGNVEALQEQGIVLEERQDLVIDGHPAVLGRGRQQLGTQVLDKWMLLIGAPQATLFVTGQMPLITSTSSRITAMDAVLASIEVEDQRPDARAALPFTFIETERFRFEQALSNNLALLTDHVVGGAAETRPLFVISSSATQSCDQWAGGKTAFAEQALQALRAVQDIHNIQHKEFANATEAEVISIAFATKNGQPVVVHQILQFRDCRYLRSLGIAPAAEEDLYREEFATLANSVEWRAQVQK
ncbi:MAG: hypothetical protein ACKVGZ_02155 [Alphaproteobacteria bacterium]